MSQIGKENVMSNQKSLHRAETHRPKTNHSAVDCGRTRPGSARTTGATSQRQRTRRSSVPTLPSEARGKDGNEAKGWNTARSFASSLRRLTVKVGKDGDASTAPGFATLVGRQREKKQSRDLVERFTKKKLVPLSQKEYMAVRGIFEEYDKSQDGSLSKEEFAAGIINHGHPELAQHAIGMFQATDKDKNGSMSFNEFLAMHCPWLSPEQAGKCIAKYGAPFCLGEEEEEARVAALEAAKVKEGISGQEKADIEAVYDTWCRKSGSPRKGGGLSFAALKRHCVGIDAYTVGGWVHEFGSWEDKRLSKEDFVQLIAGHYKPAVSRTDDEHGNCNMSAIVREQMALASTLQGSVVA